jgi:hypothetical protein
MMPMRKHRWAAERRDQDQTFIAACQLRRRVLGLRKLRNIGASIFERDKLAPVWRRDLFIEFPRPSALVRIPDSSRASRECRP